MRVLADEPASSRTYLRDVLYERCFKVGHENLDEATLRSLIAELGDEVRTPILGWPRLRAVS